VSLLTLEPLCNVYLRSVDHWDGDTPVFVPPLTTAEQATLADLQTMANFGVTLTLAEWQAVKPSAAVLKTYLGIASPTNAQTAAAVKGIVRVLATIIRS
jgi:hypothetical protein